MPSAAALGAHSRLACDHPIHRQYKAWGGVAAEIVHYPPVAPFAFSYAGNSHYLTVCEAGHRADGETSIEGLAPSRRRTLGGTMVFVPHGSRLEGWSVPRRGGAWLNVYLAPSLVEANRDAPPPGPRLHFSDPAVLATAAKLRHLVACDGRQTRLYAETLGALLMMELLQTPLASRPAPPQRGGLSALHERVLCDFIRAHLAEDIGLDRLAGLVGLSPYHVARAFKRSLGVAPHRYLNQLRIDKAKQMLAAGRLSITETAYAVGFASSSHFATIFRRVTGQTPRDFRRTLD